MNTSEFSRTSFRREAAIEKAKEMENDGADVIEVGGESARPGAVSLLSEQEKEAVLGLVRELAGELRVPVAVDTQKAEVAAGALDAGASIVNDISSLGDPGMASVLADGDCGVVLMHMRGTPESMQTMTEYEDVSAEVQEYLRQRCACAEERGITRDRIAIDPGLGLAKNRHQCLQLLSGISLLAGDGYPVMIAASRKSFIGRTLGQPPAKRLMGSLAVAAWSAANGAALIRVHDVKETVRAVRMVQAILAAGRAG